MCASTNIPGFNPAEMPAATAARASPIVLRRTPPRSPSRWLIHHVSTPAATSRRSPVGVAARIRSPSMDTTTREIPGPSRSPGAANSHFAIEFDAPPSLVAQTPASSGCGRRDRTETDSPPPSAPASTSTRECLALRRDTNFGVAADDNVIAERLHQRHADRRRRRGRAHCATRLLGFGAPSLCRLSWTFRRLPTR